MHDKLNNDDSVKDVNNKIEEYFDLSSINMDLTGDENKN